MTNRVDVNSTAAHACPRVKRPEGSSRARVRGFAASCSRSAMRLKPMAANRAAVNATRIQATVPAVNASGCAYDASTAPTPANGSANSVWGSFTKEAYLAAREAPVNVWPSLPGP